MLTVPFQLFAYLFLSRTSKLTGNRQIETFLVFLGHIVYNMLFYNIVDMCFKAQFGINSNTK